MSITTIYNVALCEDENIVSEEQELICREILNKLNIQYSISIFNNSNDFLKAFLEGAKFNLVLLDIIMDGINGMELAKKVREKDNNVSIAFITSSPDYVFQGYDVNALHYLMKPVNGLAIGKLIASDYKKRTENDYFVFESSAGTYQADLKDVIYLETKGRKVFVKLKSDEIYYVGKIAELLNLLPDNRFFRCHQSFAINISNIRELTRYTAIAVDGTKIPISRSFTKDVQRVFIQKLWEK